MIIKVQTDITWTRVLLMNEECSIMRQSEGEEAQAIMAKYCLGPLKAIFVEATLVETEDGVKLELGKQTDDHF